jgi:hypothetical protein
MPCPYPRLFTAMISPPAHHYHHHHHHHRRRRRSRYATCLSAWFIVINHSPKNDLEEKKGG